MVWKSKRTESHHHSENKCAAATNDYRKNHRQDGTASIGLVGAGKTDTIQDDFPDSADKAAAKRNDEERISRTACEADDAEGRFERLLRAADNHQAEMENRGGNEGFDGDEKWNERSEEHTSELQSPYDLVCRLLLE